MAGLLTLRAITGRDWAWLALVLVVSLAHLCLVDNWLEAQLGFGSATNQSLIRRIEVAYVRELTPVAASPVPAARAHARLSRKLVPRPAPAASAAEAELPAAAASEPSPAIAAAESASSPPALAAEAATAQAESEVSASLAGAATAALADVALAEPFASAEPAAPAPAPTVAASAEAAPLPFEWPPSTRLSYLLSGNYRGEVQGRATVEWVRSGPRYQVHLSAFVGLPFAPLMVRRVSSDGVLGETGLAPRLFDGEQRVGFATRQWSMRFEPGRVVFGDERHAAAGEGVQDEASQFVQLTWLFTTQPQRLRAGQSIEFPLALTRRVDRWVYDVVGEQSLKLPFGTVSAMHVKPRRSGRGGELIAQIWFAPTLQYLPVRILVVQDAQTYIDLLLEKPPLQEAAR